MAAEGTDANADAEVGWKEEEEEDVVGGPVRLRTPRMRRDVEPLLLLLTPSPPVRDDAACVFAGGGAAHGSPSEYTAPTTTPLPPAPFVGVACVEARGVLPIDCTALVTAEVAAVAVAVTLPSSSSAMGVGGFPPPTPPPPEEVAEE